MAPIAKGSRKKISHRSPMVVASGSSTKCSPRNSAWMRGKREVIQRQVCRQFAGPTTRVAMPELLLTAALIATFAVAAARSPLDFAQIRNRPYLNRSKSILKAWKL